MARKGCGPYGLGAPKAMATKSMAKQTETDPKSGNTVRSERQVDGGTEVTFTTTTPGSGGVDFEIQNNPIKPTKSRKQFEAEGGNWEEAQAWWKKQRDKGSVSPTSDKVTVEKRFIPNPLGFKPEGPIFRPIDMKADGIKPLAKPADTRYYGVTVDQNAGIVNPGQKSRMGTINTKFGKDTSLKPETRYERVMSHQQYSDALKNVEDSYKQDEQKVKDARANLKKRNPNASEEWINRQTAKYAGRLQARTKGIKGRSLTLSEATQVHKNYEANKERNPGQMQGTWSDEGNPNYNPLLDQFKLKDSPNNKVKSAFKMKGFGSKSYK